jgi:hypothetical protein
MRAKYSAVKTENLFESLKFQKLLHPGESPSPATFGIHKQLKPYADRHYICSGTMNEGTSPKDGIKKPPGANPAALGPATPAG